MRHLLAAAAVAAIVSGCAVTPEPCTRDFFAYKADVLQRDFASRNRGEVRRLKTLQNDLQSKPDLFTALALVSAKRDLENVIDDVRNRVIPEAQSIAVQCEIDGAFNILMDGFLVEQGIDPQLVRTLGLFDLFDDGQLKTTIEPAG